MLKECNFQVGDIGLLRSRLEDRVAVVDVTVLSTAHVHQRTFSMPSVSGTRLKEDCENNEFQKARYLTADSHSFVCSSKSVESRPAITVTLIMKYGELDLPFTCMARAFPSVVTLIQLRLPAGQYIRLQPSSTPKLAQPSTY